MAEFSYNPNLQLFNTDPSRLGKDFKTWGFDSAWSGDGSDSLSSNIANLVFSNPDLVSRFGLSSSDFYETSPQAYIHDSYNPSTYYISDAAKNALNGLTISRTGVAGVKDGRAQVLRDAQGNILYTGKPYSYDPAGDLTKAALTGLGVVGAGWGLGSLLGAGGVAGAEAGAGLSELFGAAAPAAETAGATGAFGELGAMIPSGAELGALEGGSLLAGGAGIGGSLPAGLASFAVPAEIGMAGLGLGALPEFSMAGVDATQALAGGPMGLNGLGSTSAAANYGAAGASGGLTSYIDKLLKPSTMKDIFSAGTGIYNGITRRNDAKKLMGQLNGMSAPGGAYEQALRKQLERRDAASGRRSQYGPREVELQAKLAELASRNAPSLVNLMNSSNSGLESALRNLTGGGLKLFDIFGGG